MENVDILLAYGETPQTPIIESFEINQKEEYSILIINYNKDKITLNIIQLYLLPEIFEINLAFEEIKTKHKLFSKFTSCQDFATYLKASKDNNTLDIKRINQQIISLELKQIGISLDLVKKCTNLNLKELEIYSLIFLLKNDLKNIGINYKYIKNENKNMKQDICEINQKNNELTESNKYLLNLIKDLKLKISNLNSQIFQLKEQINEMLQKDEFSKTINEIKSNSNSNNIKENYINEKKNLKTMIDCNNDLSSNNKRIKHSNILKKNSFKLSEFVSPSKKENYNNKRNININKESLNKEKYVNKIPRFNQTYKKEKSTQNIFNDNKNIYIKINFKKNRNKLKIKTLELEKDYSTFREFINNKFKFNNRNISNTINNKSNNSRKTLSKKISKENMMSYNNKKNIFFTEEKQNIPSCENNAEIRKTYKLNSMKKTKSCINHFDFIN